MQGQTLKKYIRNLKIAKGNQKLISNEFELSDINKRVQHGLVPITDERPSELENREKIISVLRNVTYEPRKFFSIVFDNYEVSTLVQYLPQFMKSVGKYRSNLSAEQLYSYWEEFKGEALNQKLEVAGIPKPEYNYDIEAAKALQGKIRTGIRTKAKEDIEKLMELEQLEKKIKKLSYDVVRFSYTEDPSKWSSLNDEYLALIKERDALVNKIKLESAKEPFIPTESMKNIFKTRTQLVQNAARSARSAELAAEKQSELQKNLQVEINKRKLTALKKELDLLLKESPDKRTKEGKEHTAKVNEIRRKMEELIS